MTILTDRIDDRRAWTATTIDDPASWTTALSADCLDELEHVVSELGDGDPTHLRTSAADLPLCAAQLAPVRQELDLGRGFALVDHLDEARFGRSGAVTAYWAVGQLLGRPFEQDVQGTLLYDVRDTGRSVTGGARFSVTRAESTFHTDNAFNDELPDFVGLLSLRTARDGGRSQLISACALYNELLEQSVDLEPLHGTFWFDRRGQHGADEAPVAARHLYCWDGSELSMRYMAYYIQVGQERAGEALSPEQVASLEAIEEVLRRPQMRVEFDLHPGQMMFTNNHWILHNRTAFTDHAEADDKRHYVRLWLSRG